MNEDDEYTTRSIFLAAYLYVNGALLVSAIDRDRRESFSFENKDQRRPRYGKTLFRRCVGSGSHLRRGTRPIAA
jgi:hypothetical protein